MWFGFDPDKPTPNAEADLLVVMDGEALICEVKSSWSVFGRQDIADLVALAKRLRPNGAVLAVMEPGAGPLAELRAAEQELATVGVKFELITAVDKFEDQPFLSFDDWES